MFDDFLRKRAASLGANLINGLFMGMDLPTSKDGSYVISYNDYASGENVRCAASSRCPLSPLRLTSPCLSIRASVRARMT